MPGDPLWDLLYFQGIISAFQKLFQKYWIAKIPKGVKAFRDFYI